MYGMRFLSSLLYGHYAHIRTCTIFCAFGLLNYICIIFPRPLWTFSRSLIIIRSGKSE